MSSVVIVESPAKAKTINKYLGREYKVLASYGHVRDLPAKDGSVRPDEDFAMSWQVDGRAERPLKEITRALKGADRLYLATDPDREGEAISWHIEQILRARKLLDDVEVRRVVFNEITEQAVRDAFAHPRDVNAALVDAYLARRALDYLVGFTLSPVLWRKLPGARSAGRVQSVALRLVCEREAEIEAFRPREYWTIKADMTSARGAPFAARLSQLDGGKLGKFDLPDRAAADAARARVEAGAFSVVKVERKRVARRPQAPFTTSTLQQEASRKLGFGATRTMRVAQRLYEGTEIGGETVGLITYMRTDATSLSGEALAGARAVIAKAFGAPYLPERPRTYRTRAKNAQEAHEAIRPTDLARRPDSLAAHLGADERALYALVWQRTVASQMTDAQLDKVAADLATPDGGVTLRATGSTIAFDGFLRLYREGKDDEPAGEEDDDSRILPPLAEGEPVGRRAVTPEQHFTQPPPRFSEASLVRRLEELGIGRPSTYASILQVLQDRQYVRLDKRRFVPEDQGRLVTSFLTGFFKRYVEYDFTARMEDRLDDVSNGGADWKAVLRDFWGAFREAVEGTKELRTRAILDALDADLGQHFFPEGGEDARRCPACAEGRLGLRLGRHGPFIGCSGYPECSYTRRLAMPGEEEDDAATAQLPRMLGRDPETGREVSLRKGPYGLYVQLDEAEGEAALAPAPAPEGTDAGEAKSKGKTKAKAKGRSKAKAKPKPKRAGLPRGMEPATITLEMALKLLALPREIGKHPEDGEVIQAGIGRYGPYLKHAGRYVSLEDPAELFTVGLNRAVALLAEKKDGAARTVGAHPGDGKPITLHRGRYGPYVKHGRVNATIPKGHDPETIDVAEAVALLAAKAGRKPAGKATPGKSAAARR